MTTVAETCVKLAERHGRVLSGRPTAISLREELESEFRHEGVVVLDFESVEAISPSFADELFGRFVDRVGREHIRFENLSPHLLEVERMVRRRAMR